MAICRCEHLKPSQRLCLLRILYFTFRTSKPLVGRNHIGRRSSVHAVRARPLLIIKKYRARRATRGGRHNPPPRGVNPETRLAPGLRPCLSYFAPMRGLSNSAGIRPRVRYFSPLTGAQKVGSLTLAGGSPTTTNLRGARSF